MSNNVRYLQAYLADKKKAEQAQLDEEREYYESTIHPNLKHYDDGEKCICWDCDEARRNPKEPDWHSLPLFRNYKP